MWEQCKRVFHVAAGVPWIMWTEPCFKGLCSARTSWNRWWTVMKWLKIFLNSRMSWHAGYLLHCTCQSTRKKLWNYNFFFPNSFSPVAIPFSLFSNLMPHFDVETWERAFKRQLINWPRSSVSKFFLSYSCVSTFEQLNTE